MGYLLRHLLYPAWHWIKRDGVNSALKQYKKNQWLGRSAILQLQEQKLLDLLSFASTYVPYYRGLVDRPGPNGDPAALLDYFHRLPPLTKATIRTENDKLVSENLEGNQLFSNSTSGSTGEAIRFYTDEWSMTHRKASGKRSDSWTGWRIGDRVVRIWGAPIDQDRAGNLRGRLHGWVTSDRLLSSFNLSDAVMRGYADQISSFRPVLIVAYPGPMEQFAIYCARNNITFPSVRAIISSAETLWPHQREAIEKAFSVRVFNRYGTREVGLIASECGEHAGLHICADRVLIEIVDDEYRPCEPGVEGRVLVTDLDNYGMPLIRYDIGDRAIMSGQESCNCGRGLPLLREVTGRTLDVIHTRDGRAIGGTFWTLLLRSRPGLKQFQVVQDDLDGVDVRFVCAGDFENDVLDYFERKIHEQCGSEFRVNFVETDIIELTHSGKRKLIVSRL